jgi:hypothetical protein
LDFKIYHVDKGSLEIVAKALKDLPVKYGMILKLKRNGGGIYKP